MPTYRNKGNGWKKIDKDKFIDCLNLFAQRQITIAETARVLGCTHSMARERIERALEIIYQNGGGTINVELFPQQWFK